MEKVRVLLIYTLDKDFDQEELDCYRDCFKVDVAICLKAENQLQHLQYPYFTIETFE